MKLMGTIVISPVMKPLLRLAVLADSSRSYIRWRERNSASNNVNCSIAWFLGVIHLLMRLILFRKTILPITSDSINSNKGVQ